MDSTSINYPKEDYTKALVNDVKGMKIGVPNDYIGEGINQDVKNAILKAVETYKMLGAEVDFFDMQASKYALPAYYIISSAEASSNLARYDGIKYGYRTDSFENLDDLYKKTRSEGFGKEVKRRIMLGTYALSSGYYDAYYKKAQQVRTVIKNDFDAAFEKYDFILTPTAPTTAFNIGSKTTDPLQMYLEDICTVSINIASVPAISIPCGFDKDNMPIGMQLIGKAFSESTLLRAAYTFEQNADIPNIRPQL